MDANKKQVMSKSNSRSSTSGKSCLIKGLLALALAGGVPILIAAIIFSRWIDSVAEELEAYKQDARAQGYPVTLEELDAWYPAVPDAENAALVYQEAFALMQAVDPDFTRLAELYRLRDAELAGSGYSPEHVDVIAGYLSVQTKGVAKLEEASRLKRARFPVDYTMGSDAVLDHLAPMRSSARLLALEIGRALAQGDSERAINNNVQMLAIVRAGGTEPSLVAQLVRIAIASMVFEELERTLSHGDFLSPELAALDAAWVEAHRPDALAQALAGERCLTSSMMISLLNDNATVNDPDLEAISKARNNLPAALFRTYIAYEELSVYRGFANAIPEGEPDWPVLYANPPMQDAAENTWAPLTAILMPALSRVHRAFIRDETIYRTARTALAVERYRLDHDALPDTLAACVPKYVPAEVIADPYTGEPLKYRPEEDGGYQVYSVFENLVDDGGERWEKQDPDSYSGDWVFSVTRSEEGKTATNHE